MHKGINTQKTVENCVNNPVENVWITNYFIHYLVFRKLLQGISTGLFRANYTFFD